MECLNLPPSPRDPWAPAHLWAQQAPATHNSPCCCWEHQWGIMLSTGPPEIPEDPLLTMRPAQRDLMFSIQPQAIYRATQPHGMLCYQ